MRSRRTPHESQRLKNYFVYIMTNKTRSTIYIGMTNDLVRRVSEHQTGETKGFTQRYHLDRVVYYEVYPDPLSAIEREKQLKGWRREKKDHLIEKMNPTWADLSPELFRGMKPIQHNTILKRFGDCPRPTQPNEKDSRACCDSSTPQISAQNDTMEDDFSK